MKCSKYPPALFKEGTLHMRASIGTKFRSTRLSTGWPKKLAPFYDSVIYKFSPDSDSEIISKIG